MTNKPKIVLDTNVLLVSISSRSKYHWIFQKLLKGHFDLFICNEILLEYDEIISKKFSQVVAHDVMRTLLILPNVFKRAIFFQWGLINADPDDNKFVDCAVSSNADYIVTNDKHFSILEQIDFPKMTILNVHEFEKLFEDRLIK